MAMVMDVDISNVPYNVTSSTMISATTTSNEGDYDSTNWSPVIGEWGELSCHGLEDLHDLIDSMMDDINAVQCNPTVTGLTTREELSPYTAPTNYEPNTMADSKLRLIHLLMAAAEALAGGVECHELARVILSRFKELVSRNDGTNVEMLAVEFAYALECLLNGSGMKQVADDAGKCFKEEHSLADILVAVQLLHDTTPYGKFGYFTANQAILEAATNDMKIHIVDYDIMEGVQWASLMQTLVSRKDSPLIPHLKITALSGGGSGERRSFSAVRETGRRLKTFAASVGLPFSFRQCRLDKDGIFRPSSLKTSKGEVLMINCMLNFPHYSYGPSKSIVSFLSESMTLNPRVITIMNEEIGSNCEGGFLRRFIDSLHHYSAIHDSLEVGFSTHDWARTLVQRVFLGPSIAETVASTYHACVEEEHGSWGQWMAAVGFVPMSISFANHCQAKLLLGLYNDGYRVEKLNINKLVLGWKSRHILSVSIWTSQDQKVNQLG